jgi:hypothetical protein
VNGTTDTTTISAIVVDAIHAITPRHVHERAAAWQYTPSDRTGGRAVMAGDALRSFDLVWRGVGPSYLWYGNGEAYTAELGVAVSYRGIPPERLAQMIGDDAIDLRSALMALGEPTHVGVSHFEHLGVGEYEIDDSANATVEHRFQVHWAQDTDLLT